jgi:hypothetical protein
MRFPSMFLALLLAPLSLSAQTAASSSQPPPAAPSQLGPAIIHLNAEMAAVQSRYASSCPVGFSIDRRPEGNIAWAGTAPTHHGPGLEIVFGQPTKIAPSQTQIVSASIAVHGMSPHARMVPLESSDAPLPDVTETFSLGGSAGQPLLNPSVWTKNMAAVTSVELTQVTYADGTTWQPSASRQCIARPSLYVPVAASK